MKKVKTYDIYYTRNNHTSNKSFNATLNYCENYLKTHANSFKGCIVKIIDKQTGLPIKTKNYEN